MSRMSLSGFLSVGVGGDADVEIVRSTESLSYRRGDIVLGRGTDVVASDGGVDGRVLVMRNVGMRFDGETAYAESGTPIASLAAAAAARGLGGLEWAAGIPGSVGGAIATNAGAFGGCAADCLLCSDILTERGVRHVRADELTFSYRSVSGLPDGIILRAAFALHRADRDELVSAIARFAERRRLTQPQGRSAGSTFLAVGGVSAGYYIERAGLKGMRIGGARISEKHANFIITDGGSASDLRRLAETAKLCVYAQFGVRLHEEIRYIGEF